MADSGRTPLAVIGSRLGALGRTLGGPAFRTVTAPPIALAGAAVATQAARVWGRILGGHERRVGDLHVVTGLPTWAFGRGGTTVGAAFLTNANVSPGILAHEEVHRQQWLRYGLAFIPLYYAAGIEATTNRFEIEAGLELGGYLPTQRPPRGRRTPKAS